MFFLYSTNLLLKNLVCLLVFEQELTTYSYSRTIITVPDLHFTELFHISKNIMTNSCFPKLTYALVLLLLRASGSILGFNCWKKKKILFYLPPQNTRVCSPIYTIIE